MDQDLPLEYDVIIVGTGMIESIIAAAVSRVDKTVLHLDTKEYYGGDWASFNFDSLQKYIDEIKNQPDETPKNIHKVEQNTDNTLLLRPHNELSRIYNVEQNWFVGTVPIGPQKLLKNNILKEYRKFNLDLTPKLMFARGDMIKLLISSNTARYAEFRCVTRVLTMLPNQNVASGRGVSGVSSNSDPVLSTVPCSRSDVFATKNVSVVEKRMLMKLLNSCLAYKPNEVNEEFKGFETKTFLSYLKHKKLTPNLIHYVLYAIAMSDDLTPCDVGILKVRRFLESLGHYGNTPFLYPMYGNGEVPQYFCRLCAVFGGLYCLKLNMDGVAVTSHDETKERQTKQESQDGAGSSCAFDETILQRALHSGGVQTDDVQTADKTNDAKSRIEYRHIVCGKQNLTSKHLVMNVNYAPQEFFNPDVNAEYNKLVGDVRPDVSNKRSISRGIFITDRSILEDDREHVTLLKIPPQHNNCHGAVVMELGKQCCVCPDNLYIVHMTCRHIINAKTDLKPFVEQILYEGQEVIEPIQDANREDESVLSTSENDPITEPETTASISVDVADSSTSEATKTEAEQRDENDPRPRILWSLYFNMNDFSNCDLNTEAIPRNLYLCSGPDIDLDYDNAIKQAKDIFTSMFPDCEFLPRAPDPEEIVFDDFRESENGSPNSTGSGDKTSSETAETGTVPEPESSEVIPDCSNDEISSDLLSEERTTIEAHEYTTTPAIEEIEDKIEIEETK